MRNEAAAFSFQPNNKVEIPTPNQSTEKKSAVILQFSKKENSLAVEKKETKKQVLDVIANGGYEDSKNILKDYFKSEGAKLEDFYLFLNATRQNKFGQLAVFKNIDCFSNPEDLEEILKYGLDNLIDFDSDERDTKICDDRFDLDDIKTEVVAVIEDCPTLSNIMEEDDERFDEYGTYFENTITVYKHAIFDELEKLGDIGEQVVISYLQRERQNRKHTPHDHLEKETLHQDYETTEDDLMDEEGDVAYMWDRNEAALEYDNCYDKKMTALDFLTHVGSKKSVDFAISFMERDSNAVFLYKEPLAEILSRQSEYSAEKLFEIIDSSSKIKDDQMRKDALKLLCRIELGRIGISEEGIKYFEATYDVGEFNDSQYFAQRLTGDGNIGIFDDQRVLQRYFNISETVGAKGTFEPRLLEMTHETLFVSKENETPEEEMRRQKYLEEFRNNYFNFYGDDFFNKTKIRFNNLSFREQGWFLLVNKHADEQKQEKLLNFARKFGENGLKTFLSLEFDEEMGDRVLAIADSLKEKDVAHIFASYGKIIDSADDAQHEIENVFKKIENIASADVERLRLDLFSKSRQLLVHFFEKVDSGEEMNFEGILKELDHFRRDVVFLTSVFKTFAKNNPDISFDDFRGIALETGNGVEISENKEDCARMIAVSEKNYLENESLKKLVVESLEEGLQKENSQFYILRHNGEIVAFCRFDDEKEYFYAGSFNVDPDYRGSAIGEVMMKESLDKKALEKPVHAITNPEKKICSKYVEDEGFIIGGILYTEFEGKTLEEVDIIRDDVNNKNYAYRQNGITPENLLDIYQDQKSKKRSDIIKSKDPFIVQFTKDEMSRFLNVADKLCKEYGYVITRYLPVDKNEGRMFATFEQKL